MEKWWREILFDIFKTKIVIMAVSVGAKVNTPFGSGVVCNKRKDGGVDVVGFAFFFIPTIFFLLRGGTLTRRLSDRTVFGLEIK